ncbi:hypothetical protein ACOMHN_005545 [Nucella lapillus]
MVGIITQSTSLNSFWSISFCVLALGLQGYATYLAAQRYREASGRAWPGPASKGGTPGEVATHLALLILACLLLPFFVAASFLRVGNYANDGVKLGRDHALNPNLDAWCPRLKPPWARRAWSNCVPLAHTVYLAAAFLLLLPDTLLTAVEVDYGYKTSVPSFTRMDTLVLCPSKVVVEWLNARSASSSFRKVSSIFSSEISRLIWLLLFPVLGTGPGEQR